MINIVIIYKNNLIEKICAEGHAGAGVYGHDLVCAAVSASITGCMNTLLHGYDYHIELKEGYFLFENNKKVDSYHDNVVLETLITTLKTINESRPQNIRIEENYIHES